MPKTIQEFFKWGLDRDIPELAQCPFGYPSLELGPGKRKKIPTMYKLGLPEWDARRNRIPFEDGSIGEVMAFQFMEHLTGEVAVQVLREVQRVLVPGGVFTMVSPYYNSAHQAQALDHKSFWSEETWHWLFGNEYYDDHEHQWQLKVHCCFIMGIVERNLDLFVQLVKEG